MATSGSLNTSGYEGRYLQLTWSRQSYDIASNPATSAIAWELRGAGSASSSWYYAGPFNVEINGQKVYQSSNRVQLYEGTLVASGTLTIAHSADGTCSFGAYVSAAIYSSSVNVDGSGSWALDALPRASSISCGTLTMGAPGTITISAASASFTHTLAYAFGDASGTIATGVVGGTVAWTPPLDLAYQIPNAASGTGTLICTTYSGGTAIGTQTINITISVPVSVTPTITACDLSPVNVNAWVAGKGIYAAQLSRMRVVTSCAPAYGSDVTVTISGAFIGSGYDWTSDILPPGTHTFTVTATDRRGRSAAVTRSVTVLPYMPPSIAGISYERGHNSGGTWTADPGGSDLKVWFTVGLSLTDQGNVASLVVALTGMTSKSTAGVTPGLVAYYFDGIGVDTSRTLTVTITDSVGVTPSPSQHLIATMAVAANYNPETRALCFGGVAEIPNAVDFANPLYIKGNPVTAHVIGVGWSNGWYYHKWSTGWVEAWCPKLYTGITIGTAWGGLYESNDAYALPTIGLTFASLVRYTVECAGSSGRALPNVINQLDPNTGNISFGFSSATPQSGAAAYVVGHLIGY